MRNRVFIKVEPDVAGLHGWGEASLEWKTRSVVGADEEAARRYPWWRMSELLVEKFKRGEI